ncbi:MAG: hypothetical protein H7Y38_17255, partial [Armatimonadetes bacterium]|nr:hypothetical protein [Armatimonadota bacterium]
MTQKSFVSPRVAVLPLLGLLVFGSVTAPAAFARQASPPATPPAPLSAPATDAASDPLARIRDEGINRSQVMQTISYLTDVIGPRLTNSPGMTRANQWSASQLTKWGLANAHQEAWGPFGRGWSLQKFSAQVVGSEPFPLIVYPKAWSPGVKGTLTAPVVYLNPTTEAELAAYKGKIKGAIVLNGAMRELPAHFDPQARRYSDDELLKMAQATKPEPGARRPTQTPTPEQRAATEFAAKRTRFLYDEGAALLIDAGRIGDDGTVYVQSAAIPPPTPSGTLPPPAQTPAPSSP